MTNEEAIMRLEALRALSSENSLKTIGKAIDMAIYALSVKKTSEPLTMDHLRKTWEPCEACKDGNIKINIPEFRALAICNQHMDHEAFTLTLQTRFCPVCGRPLAPEAWAELEKRLRGEKSDGNTSC